MEILEVSLERDQAGSRSASGCEFDSQSGYIYAQVVGLIQLGHTLGGLLISLPPPLPLSKKQ